MSESNVPASLTRDHYDMLTAAAFEGRPVYDPFGDVRYVQVYIRLQDRVESSWVGKVEVTPAAQDTSPESPIKWGITPDEAFGLLRTGEPFLVKDQPGRYAPKTLIHDGLWWTLNGCPLSTVRPSVG